MKNAFVLVASVALFGCGSDATSSSHHAASDSVAVVTDSSASASQITIIELKFSVPDNAMSTDRFEVVNNDAVAHNFMLLDDTVSVEVAAGETVALPQFKPGKYPFHCHIHPSMMGELVVS